MLKITAVSYLNTFPFVYGLRESGHLGDFSLDLAVPSLCAENLSAGKADIALVPAGALQLMPDLRLLSDFCIGANGPVRTVLLLSKVPVENIRTIHLDFDSMTSVRLVRILARHYWKISPEYISLKSGATGGTERYESLVAIGDKTFDLKGEYPFVYDLAECWIDLTGLPFVFAAWASTRELPREIVKRFNLALEFGVNNKAASLEYFSDALPGCGNCLDYLENNISYPFDDLKHEGLGAFLGYLAADRMSD